MSVIGAGGRLAGVVCSGVEGPKIGGREALIINVGPSGKVLKRGLVGSAEASIIFLPRISGGTGV